MTYNNIPPPKLTLSQQASLIHDPIYFIETHFKAVIPDQKTINEIESSILQLCHMTSGNLVTPGILFECLTRLTQARNLCIYTLSNP
jgi:hypothetical protein